ncbi:MAG: hypothetical protein LBQ55_08035 [Treponema sp.]|jgi:hypothetical protein|nr:hypothetical protein [Treponema sp.]
MTIVIFTKKKAAVFGLDKKAAAAVRFDDPAALGKHSPREGDLSYLDISGLSGAEMKKAAALLKKRCGSSFWGIVDPKGEAPDPALFFYDGASDYAGPKAAKALGMKRFAAAAAWRRAVPEDGQSRTAPEAPRLKLPAGKFPGWRSVASGSTQSFFFLFVSLSGNANFRSRLGEEDYRIVRNRLRELLQHNLRDADALLWMETETNCLYLVPPRVSLVRAAIAASLRMICATPLIGMEKLGLSIPVNLTFALHYGKTVFRAPGKTGTVVSDAVNYIFHLGAKHAEPDRLTVSADIGGGTVPPGLEELFVDAGEFEGIPIRHSRRFAYSK